MDCLVVLPKHRDNKQLAAVDILNAAMALEECLVEVCMEDMAFMYILVSMLCALENCMGSLDLADDSK